MIGMADAFFGIFGFRRIMIRYEIPIRTISEANNREHWAAKAKRTKSQRLMSRLITISALSRHKELWHPMTITLVRHGKRKMDSDNLARSFKAVRDGIAEAIGIDDGDDRINWQYRQEKAKGYTVIVEIT